MEKVEKDSREKQDDRLDDSLRFIAKYSLVFFVGIWISKFLSYIFRIVIARYMHAEVYGVFSIASAITDCFIAIFTLGLAAGLLRYISFYRGKEEHQKISHLIMTSIFIVTISGIFGGLIMFLFSGYISTNIFHNSNLKIFLMWFSITVPIIIFSSIFITVMQAFERVRWITYIRNILFNVVELVVLIPLFIMGFGVNALIFSYIAGALSLLIPSFIFCKYMIPKIFRKSDLSKEVKKELNKELFLYSWPLIFIGLINFIFSWTDTFLIGIFKGVSEVGIYNVAFTIASLLSVAPGIFTFIFIPLIIKEYAKKNHNVINDISKQIVKWILIINIPVIIIMILFPGTIINILFGPEYLGGTLSLRFLGIGIFFSSLFSISESLLSMVGKSKIILANIIAAALINFTLNLILIPIPNILGLDNSSGIVGASIATMTTYITWSLMSLYQAKKYSGVTPVRRKMITLVLVAMVPTVVIIIIKRFIPINIMTMIFMGILFLLIYFIMILVTKCLDDNDMMILNAVKNKLWK